MDDETLEDRCDRPKRHPRGGRIRGVGDRVQGRHRPVRDVPRHGGDPEGASEGLRERRGVQVATGRPAPPAGDRRRPARTRSRIGDRAVATAMLFPSVAAIAIFVYGFVGWTGYVSFTRWNDVLPDYAWAGLRTYADLFETFRFRIDLLNTVKFTLVFLAGCVGAGFALAVLLDRAV